MIFKEVSIVNDAPGDDNDEDAMEEEERLANESENQDYCS